MGIAAFIDAEHALDPVYAKKLGVDIDNLIVAQPDTGEQALEIAEQLIRSGAVDIITIDSVAALVPKAEIDGEMGDSHVGLQARLMSQALRKLTGVLNKSKTVAIFINIGKAVRASCSYPVVFSPCEFNNTSLIDGGIRENTPWKELKEIGTDKVISVVFKEIFDKECCMNIIDVAARSIE